MRIRCPDCRETVDIEESSIEIVICPSCGSRMDWLAETTTMPYGPPRALAHFELIERLGAGHFGEVWKARDTHLERLVAVKFPRTAGQERSSLEFFLREARAAAKLRHPHIVPVHEVGREGDTVFIVSDFIRGVPLSADLLVHPRTPRQAAQLCATIAEALEHAHASGIVHRDLKPGNIMIDDHGEPHIMDFGLAKREDSDATLTVEGLVLGTPAYMSPEQARGESHRADRRSDIYSLGVILYEMLTGRRPFRGDSRLLVHQVLNDEPAPPRKTNRRIPRDLETICLKAMAKQSEHRYATARAMADDLERFLRGEPIAARRAGRVERTWRWARRNPGKTAAATIISALALVAAGATVDSWRVRSKHAPIYRDVRVKTKPPGASLTFIPLNPHDGRPQFELVGASQISPLHTRLAPGEYLVVAELSDERFHEVVRWVPAPDEDTWRAPYPHSHWEIASDGAVLLDTITIPPAPPGMARFEAHDNVTIGSAELGVAPPHQRRVPGFFLDATEVTIEQYRKVMNRLPRRMTEHLPDDYAAAWVTYDEAVDYAERVGKRLMDEAEYEVAATNGGTQEFPWGDQLDPLDEWTFGPVGQPDFDRIGDAPPVLGLYSNVAEWTSSSEVFYPSSKRRLPESRQSKHRVVRGGTASVARGSPQRAEFSKGPRWRFLQRPEDAQRGLGFRCARSVKPRKTADDFVQVLTAPAGAPVKGASAAP